MEFQLGDWGTTLLAQGETVYAGDVSGGLTLFSASKNAKLATLKPHTQSISQIKQLDENTIVTSSQDSQIKIFDVRSGLDSPIKTLQNSRKLPIFSLDVSFNGVNLAAGSELKQQDVELTIWDSRKWDLPARSMTEGHQDDITSVQFHPTRPNVLMSGSTDGCVNIYDLNIIDEEESLFQSVNDTSVHAAKFLSLDKFFILTHMESLSVWDLSTDKETTQDSSINVKQIGDVREKWGCNYIIDIVAPNYVMMGSYEEQSLTIAKFENEFDQLEKVSTLNGGHGEEVIRDVLIYKGIVWSTGEDSLVKVWDKPTGEELDDTRNNFIVSSEPAFANEIEIDHEEKEIEPMEIDYSAKLSKKEKKKKSHKSEKSSKHKDKDGSKSKSKKKSNRFTPY